MEEARQEAERVKADARQEADSWVTEREALRAEAEREMADLSGRVAAVRRELAVLATGVADSLDKMDAAIESATAEQTPAGSEEETLWDGDAAAEIADDEDLEDGSPGKDESGDDSMDEPGDDSDADNDSPDDTGEEPTDEEDFDRAF